MQDDKPEKPIRGKVPLPDLKGIESKKLSEAAPEGLGEGKTVFLS